MFQFVEVHTNPTRIFHVSYLPVVKLDGMTDDKIKISRLIVTLLKLIIRCSINPQCRSSYLFRKLAVNTTTHKKPSINIEPCKHFSRHAVFHCQVFSNFWNVFKLLPTLSWSVDEEDFVVMPIDLGVIQSTVIVDRPITNHWKQHRRTTSSKLNRALYYLYWGTNSKCITFRIKSVKLIRILQHQHWETPLNT